MDVRRNEILTAIPSRKTFASTHGDHTVKIICLETGRVIQVRSWLCSLMTNKSSNLLLVLFALCRRLWATHELLGASNSTRQTRDTLRLAV